METKNVELALIKGCNIIKESKPIKDELKTLLTQEKKQKMKKTIGKGMLGLIAFIVSCLGMLTYASYVAMNDDNTNAKKMEALKNSNFEFENTPSLTTMENAIKSQNLTSNLTKKNISLTHTYLKSSFDLLTQNQLNSVFSGYTTTIYPIRIKLERFMQDVKGVYFKDEKVTVASDGGFYIFKDEKNIGETISKEEYSFDRNSELILIAKDIYKPLNIISVDRRPWGSKTNLNSFRGVLEFKPNEIINELDIEQYIRGIGESASWTAPEKMKMQAILARSYAYFYMYSGFKKFKDANYILTDSPANSQKYVWAGVTNGQNWQDAASSTIGEILVDKNGDLFIAPYSTCSYRQADGKVRRKTLAEASWGEEKMVIDGKTKLKFGADVLKPVDDTNGECREKQSGGHGVGLSGNGAEYMASQQGKKALEIIQYYYNGVSVKNIF